MDWNAFSLKNPVNVELDVLGMAVTQAEVISTCFIAGILLWAVLGRKKGG